MKCLLRTSALEKLGSWRQEAEVVGKFGVIFCAWERSTLQGTCERRMCEVNRKLIGSKKEAFFEKKIGDKL